MHILSAHALSICVGGAGGEAVEFECTVHRNQCGLGIEVSDDNRILSIHPDGGAAASALHHQGQGAWTVARSEKASGFST